MLYLAGDININIDRSSRTKTANDYINKMLSYNVIPIITLPTRVTSRSLSIIDHIITNDVNHNIIPFVIPVRDDLSDHYVVGCCINDFSKPPLKKKQELFVRDKSGLNSELFCEDLTTNLSLYFEKLPALNNGNYNKIFDGFSQTIPSTIDIHAPKKKLSRRQQRLQNKPWLTKGIFVSIRKRRFMFKSYFLLGNDGQNFFFRKYSNKLTKIIALAKKSYYSSALNQNKNNQKKIWEIIRSIIPLKSKSTSSFFDCFNTKKIVNTSTDPKSIPNSFNKFFCTIGKNLADDIPQSDTIQHFSNYLSNHVSDSIFLKSPSTTEILNVIFSLNTNKAVGHYDISAYFLKVASTIIAPSLQFSFINGIFPENCSLAKIIPLHKRGNRTNPSKYRPISILTCFSKILERLMYYRFLEFFKKNNVVHKSQYGFQKHIAPSHACLDIVTTTLDNINQRKYTGLIFLDLQKAFDTVSHNTLYKIITLYKIHNHAVQKQALDSNRDSYAYTLISGNYLNNDII